MTNNERRMMRRQFDSEQAAQRQAMARAQRNGATARVGLPAVPEPSHGMEKVDLTIEIPGCAEAIHLVGWDVHFGDQRHRVVEQNPVVGQTAARRWIADQRKGWLRVHHARDLRLQIRGQIAALIQQIASLTDGNDALLGPVCAYLGEAALQLKFSVAQIQDDGTLAGEDTALVLTEEASQQ